MEKESILLVILFEKKAIDTQKFVRFCEEKLSQIFDATFDEFSYSVLMNTKLKSKSLRYSQKNLEKLYSESSLMGMELLHLLPNWKHKSKDVKFSIVYSENLSNSESSIFITLNKEDYFSKYSKQELVQLYLDLLRFLTDQHLVLTYGFGFSFPMKKFPTLYAAGIGSEELSKSEERSMQKWAEELNRSNQCIWDIFWLNLVTKNHFRPVGDWDKVRTIVGNENFIQVNVNTFLFFLADSDLSYNGETGSNKELRKFLNVM